MLRLALRSLLSLGSWFFLLLVCVCVYVCGCGTKAATRLSHVGVVAMGLCSQTGQSTAYGL